MASWGWTGVLLAVALAPCAAARALDAPLPPTDLAAVATGGGVRLDWHAPAFDGGHPVESYAVYRLGDDGTGWALIGAVAAPDLTFTDAAPSGPLVYQVQAVNAAGSSVASPPAAPLSMCSALVVPITLPTYPEVNWQCIAHGPTITLHDVAPPDARAHLG
jgi:hypothetical protein